MCTFKSQLFTLNVYETDATLAKSNSAANLAIFLLDFAKVDGKICSLLQCK
jgi:hypothetical protein